MRQPVGSYSRRRLVLTFAALFALCHAGYYLAGIRLDTRHLTFGASAIDPELLRHHLAQSILYLHSQPALYNLFLGIIYKLFPGREAAAITAVYLLLGLMLYVTLFVLLRRMGVSAGLSLALSTWFMVSPSFVLYEHAPAYTISVTALLALSALAFHQLVRQPARRWAWCYFALVGVLGALQALFHLVYYAGSAAAVMWLSPRRRRLLLLPALAPFLLLLAIYTKNLVLFGRFTTSTWFGMNFAAVTVRALPEEERRQLVAEGKLSPLALVKRFSELSAYPPGYANVHGFEGVPVLREATKSTGAKNCNHLAYLALCDQYLKDDLYIVIHRPKTFLVGLLNAWLSYFRSSSDYPIFAPGDRQRTFAIRSFYDHLFFGEVPRYRLHLGGIRLYYTPGSEPRLYLFLLVGLPLLFRYGLLLGLRRGSPLTRDQRLLVLYACANILYVAVCANFVEVSENQRFRFTTDPLSIVLLGAAIQYWALPRLSRRGAGAAVAELQGTRARRSRADQRDARQ